LFVEEGVDCRGLSNKFLGVKGDDDDFDDQGRNNNKRQLSPSSSTKKIVIVGAGAAAIQLAHTLWKESSSNNMEVTILEANDYIGGRVCSAKFHGHTVERGANWISGRETQIVAFGGDDDGTADDVENPIWTLAKQIQLQGQVSERDDAQRLHVIDTTKTKISSCTVASSTTTTDEYLAQEARFKRIYEKVLQEATAASTQRGTAFITPQDDVSVRSLLEKHGWTRKANLTNVERAVEHNVLEVWIADTLEQLGAAHDLKPGANDVDLGSDEMFVQDARGFNSIFKTLVEDLKTPTGGAGDTTTTTNILLNKQVHSIHYEPGQVKVVVKNVKNSTDDGEKEYKEEEEVYHADLVVSTVSLGVLQSQSIQFVPPLPGWKVKALHEVGMFTFAKVFCKFKSKHMWPKNKDYLLFISDGESKRGHYPLWMKYNKNNDADDAADESIVCMCYLGGAEARRVESLDEEHVKDEIEELFSKAFLGQDDHAATDDDDYNIVWKKEDCRPVSVAVTDWSRNPRFCGSYSYFPVGAFASVPEADYRCGLTGLAAHDVSNSSTRSGQVGPNHEREVDAPTTLYFAGEAFDDKFNGWVQGGYLSGQRVTRRILQDLQPRQTRPKTKN
jgi:polyamine oxidase